MSEHILAAYEFDENGGGKKLTSSEIQSSINSPKPAWVHLDANHPDTKKSIKIVKKLIKGQGRILVRKSGTESKIRVMGESENKELLKKCVYLISRKIK